MAALAPPFEQTYPLSPPSTPPPLLVGDACTLPGAAPALQHFKLSHASTTRLLALPLAQLSYPALLVAAAALFALPLGAVRALQHTDADGDVVTLSSEADAATAQPPPAPLPLARRKSLAALANFLAPNRHIASSSSSSTSTPGDAQQGEQAPEAPPSYYHVLRMTAAQEGGAQRLGRGLVGACE
ncbi:hypothetical protein JCM10449v2_001319 [Rhodotorula kratochvilovae]